LQVPGYKLQVLVVFNMQPATVFTEQILIQSLAFEMASRIRFPAAVLRIEFPQAQDNGPEQNEAKSSCTKGIEVTLPVHQTGIVEDAVNQSSDSERQHGQHQGASGRYPEYSIAMHAYNGLLGQEGLHGNVIAAFRA
jgi:hypothetical protein